MLSFANTHLSFYCLLFLLCVTTGLVASAPTTHHRNNRNHHHNLHSRPFPYGKLGDRLLHSNDRNNDVPYMIDNNNLDEDMVRVYPNSANHHNSVPLFPSSLPIAPPSSGSGSEPLLPIKTTPKVGITTTTTTTKDVIFSFAYRLPDIIKKFLDQEWETTLVRWRSAMAGDQLSMNL